MKTPGQVAHAAFCESVKAFRPFGVRAAEWSELTDIVRQAWEAAAQAVMNPPHVEAPSGLYHNCAKPCGTFGCAGPAGPMTRESVAGGVEKMAAALRCQECGGDAVSYCVCPPDSAKCPPSLEERVSRLTSEHMAALRRYAASNGRTWRIRLRAAWEAGTLTNYTSAEDADLLQRVRNILSPSGLAAIRL